MFVQIITNTVKPGAAAQYISVSKEFMDAIVVRAGALSAEVFTDAENPDAVVNIVKWSSKEKSDGLWGTGVTEDFFPRLTPFFVGNSTVSLNDC